MNFARYNIPPHGAFWCRLDLVDATADDIQANDAGRLPEERRLSIKASIEMQLYQLARSYPEGNC